MRAKVIPRLAATELWLQRIVIGQRLCPFAQAVSRPPKLRLVTSDASTVAQAVADVTGEVAAIMDRVRDENRFELPETTLLIFDHSNPLVRLWPDFVRLSWAISEQSLALTGASDHLQIVLFHPQATHSTYNDGPPDAADFTIRSPHPTLHLLREKDVLSAVRGGVPDLALLPQRNRVRLREQGYEACHHRLEGCRDP
jgi:hypothetical protein